MIRVSIVKDWKYPDILRQSPGNKGVWEGVEFVDGLDPDSDFLIVFNAPNRKIEGSFIEGGKWLFSQESPIPLYEWHLDSYHYFDKVYGFWPTNRVEKITHEQTSLPWHIDLSYDDLCSLKADELDKCKKVSWVTSNASHKPGHKLRMGFKDFLLDNEFEFDLYGRGFAPIKDKFDALKQYQYSLAIENFQVDDYWTEKFADCILSWTMPIYYGCSNILEYFPENCMIQIDPNRPKEAMKTIKEAIDGDLWRKNLDAIAEARMLILDKYQLFPSVASKVKAHLLIHNQKNSVFIPPNEHFNRDKISFKRFLSKLKSKLN